MARSAAINALLLAEDESCLTVDRMMLRRLGLTQTQFFASGRKALDHLRPMASHGPARPAMLICNERLADMTGMRFLSHLRSMPGLADIPVLFLVSNGESVVALAARASNSCAVLARPYTEDQAQAALLFAAKPEARHAPLVLPPSFIDRFGPQAKQLGTAREENKPLPRGAGPQAAPRASQKAFRATPGETALREGLAALGRGDAAAADSLLRGSYQTDPGNSEICLALSKLAAHQHQEREELMWLCKAGVLCLKYGDRPRANTIFNRLPRGKIGQDPLLAEAGLILQEGETRAAALSFLEAHRLDPSRPLHALVGRTCIFTPAPEEHMHGLIRALSRMGHEATASKLRQRLLQPPREEEERRDRFLENFPLLHDIVAVASHTFRTWRQAA